jgi:hypothetical protein
VKDIQDAAKFALSILSDARELMLDTTVPTEIVELRGLERVRALQISAFVGLVVVGLVFASLRTSPNAFDSVVFLLLTLLYCCALAIPVAWLMRVSGLHRTNEIYSEALAISVGFLLVTSCAAVVVHIANIILGFGLTRETFVPTILVTSAIASLLVVGLRSFFRSKARGKKSKSAPVWGLLVTMTMLLGGAELFVYLFLIVGFGK